MIRVLFDHQIFTYQTYGGISRYFCELMDQYSQSPDMNFTLALRASFNKNLCSRPRLDPHWSNRSRIVSAMRILPCIQKRMGLNLLNLLYINQSESIARLKKQDFDIFHPTYYDRYFLKHLKHKPFVLTIHDMIHELCSENFSRDPVTLWKKELMERAGAIIAISKNTKNDILNFYDIDPDRISVVYDANPFEFLDPGTTTVHPPHDFPEKPYLLFVGNRTGYKNFLFFITAIAGLLKKENLRICCAGGGPFTAHEKKIIGALDISSNVYVIEADDHSMQLVYANARAFVFPSLYEGFGLPVLEAFSCGCPVVMSNAASLPEIGGDAACYFDPRDPVSLLHVLESAIGDNRLRENCVRKGFVRLNEFSWKKTAQETKKIYEKVVGHS